ncbi:MAG: phytanoyl-CoA dioxygenase family protein [Halofilum sp. (in: g-proteobacteria)]|nr:phytanoyl-CoA dioxygenase family protein [Halofilum sp. (in: g-proteobacteria)]
MTSISFLAEVPPPDRLRARAYAGELLVLRDLDALHGLREHLHAAVCEAFDSDDPVHAQFTLGRDEWDRRAVELRARCRRDERTRELMTALLAGLGVEPARTAADAVNLRCQPHAEAPAPDPRHTLGAHRDTWGSNVYQQLNWWAPVCPLTPRRTIAFFPGRWDRPVANDSADWDLERIGEELRQARTEGRAPAIRTVPEPTEPLDPSEWLPVVIEPGDLLLFSGAHLHASVPNDSGGARYSLELRTLDLEDAAAGIGAPNLDGAAPRVAWHWFRRLDDGSRLQSTGPGRAPATAG